MANRKYALYDDILNSHFSFTKQNKPLLCDLQSLPNYFSLLKMGCSFKFSFTLLLSHQTRDKRINQEIQTRT